MTQLKDIKVQLYADGANKEDILKLYANPMISGFTTNPTLLKKAGIKDYTAFAKDLLSVISDRPISFEVFADDFETMFKQAKIIKSWGQNVFVKIPVMNTKREYSYELIEALSNEGCS